MDIEEPRPTLDLRKPIKTRDGEYVRIRYIVGRIDCMFNREGESVWNVYGEKVPWSKASDGGSYGVNGDYWWHGPREGEPSKNDLVQAEEIPINHSSISELELSEAIKASGHVDAPSVRRWMRRALEAAQSVKNSSVF